MQIVGFTISPLGVFSSLRVASVELSFWNLATLKGKISLLFGVFLCHVELYGINIGEGNIQLWRIVVN